MMQAGVSPSAPMLTPRQDRLEAAIARVFLARGTRSQLRDAVYQLVDLFRVQGVSPDVGIRIISDVSARAALASSGPGDADDGEHGDRLTLVGEWAAHRYARDD